MNFTCAAKFHDELSCHPPKVKNKIKLNFKKKNIIPKSTITQNKGIIKMVYINFYP